MKGIFRHAILFIVYKLFTYIASFHKSSWGQYKSIHIFKKMLFSKIINLRKLDFGKSHLCCNLPLEQHIGKSGKEKPFQQSNLQWKQNQAQDDRPSAVILKSLFATAVSVLYI